MARVKRKGKWYDGDVCPLGHGTQRFTANGTCVVCARDRQRKTLYGLTPEAFAAMLAGQGDACAVCRTKTPPRNHDTRDGWHVDHDHKTGAVRGVLCSKCNRALGLLGDDPERVARAAEYLQ